MRLKNTISYAIVAAGLGGIAVWLLFVAACMYDRNLPLCRHPAGSYIVLILFFALTLIPLARLAYRRAQRGVGRGLYARPVGRGRSRALEQVSRLLASTAHLAIEGEWPRQGRGRGETWHPLVDVPPGHGWDVPLEDGTMVRVYWDDFREWIYKAWELQQDPRRDPRQGATSQSTWDPIIGRNQTQARNHLLELAGGVRRNKATANSTRRIAGTPWRILADLYDRWPPGELM